MTLFLLWTWFICVAPTPFIEAATCQKKSCFISTLLIYILEYIYITFICNIVMLLNILFRYNTLYTYTSKIILWIVGIIFIGFLRSVEHLQVFECPVAMWSVTSADHLSSHHQRGHMLLTVNKSPKWNHIQPGKMWEKQYNVTLPPVLRGM
jgi:hypothetical protein